jgi:hypothetical protein
LHRRRVGKLPRPRTLVIVAAYGCHGRDACQGGRVRREYRCPPRVR